jgi:DNA-binding CsgD family transcriptional regulator
LIAARVMVIAERYDAALAALNRGIEMARARGSAIALGGGLAFRAELHLRTGDLSSAEVDARTLLEIAAGTGWHGGAGFAKAWLGALLVDRGELDEAEQVLGRGDGDAIRGYTTAEVLLARGRLRLARGDVDEGIELLRESGRWSTRVDVLNPAAAPWRSELAHALTGAGRTDEARRLAAEEIALTRSFGAPRATAVALRAAARVEGGAEAVALLREAICLLEDSPAVLERARAYAALGAALRAAVAPLADTRDALRTAVDLAHRRGARALEDEALDELRATGARPRRRRKTGTDALTPSERRIADLAAGGQQNREIAQALFVTTHTVEFHLRNAYRKLGITSRTELPGALGAV